MSASIGLLGTQLSLESAVRQRRGKQRNPERLRQHLELEWQRTTDATHTLKRFN